MRADHSEGFQSTHAPETGGRRDRELLGEIPQPAAIVLLQEPQQPLIEAVERSGTHTGPAPRTL